MSKQESGKARQGRRKATRANGVATRKRILEVATTMFAASGYEATSLRQISAGAKVDLATLKYHFGTKDKLFGAVYQRGYESFSAAIAPLLMSIPAVSDRAQALEWVRGLVTMAHDFIGSNPTFIRLLLFRILEDSAELTTEEEALQSMAISMLESAVEMLAERGVMRPVDTRATVVLMFTSIPMWFVTSETKRDWIGEPAPLHTPEGRARSEAFLVDLLERLMLAPQEPSAS